MKIKIKKGCNQIVVNTSWESAGTFESNETVLITQHNLPLATTTITVKEIEDFDVVIPEWFANAYSINEDTDWFGIMRLPVHISCVDHIYVEVLTPIDLLDIENARKEIQLLGCFVNGMKNVIISHGNSIVVNVIGPANLSIFSINKHTRISFKGYGVISMEDIGGQDELLDWYYNVYLFSLEASEYLQKWKIPTPRGVLLSGRPGLGKTHFLKALIADCGVKVISISAPKIITPLAGEGDATLEQVFGDARQFAPSIICIDEVDALCLNRNGSNANYENRVVTVLLKELDGLETRGNVLVIGTTNRPESIDPAFLRPGRFTYHIGLKMPNEKDRLEIIKIHLRTINHNISLQQLKEVSKKAEGLTGAEITSKIHSAAIDTIRAYVHATSSTASEPELNFQTLLLHF